MSPENRLHLGVGTRVLVVAAYRILISFDSKGRIHHENGSLIYKRTTQESFRFFLFSPPMPITCIVKSNAGLV